MSAFEQIEKLVNRGGLDIRRISDNEVQIYNWPEPGTDEHGEPFDYPEQLLVTIRTDADHAVTSTHAWDALDFRTVIAQLSDTLKVFEREFAHYNWDELTGLKLEYRKVGDKVEVDIVSFTYNWWSYEKDGVKYQALFSDEFHEGPHIRAVEATLLYDPATNRLLAR